MTLVAQVQSLAETKTLAITNTITPVIIPSPPISKTNPIPEKATSVTQVQSLAEAKSPAITNAITPVIIPSPPISKTNPIPSVDLGKSLSPVPVTISNLNLKISNAESTTIPSSNNIRPSNDIASSKEMKNKEPIISSSSIISSGPTSKNNVEIVQVSTEKSKSMMITPKIDTRKVKSTFFENLKGHNKSMLSFQFINSSIYIYTYIFHFYPIYALYFYSIKIMDNLIYFLFFIFLIFQL